MNPGIPSTPSAVVIGAMAGFSFVSWLGFATACVCQPECDSTISSRLEPSSSWKSRPRRPCHPASLRRYRPVQHRISPRSCGRACRDRVTDKGRAASAHHFPVCLNRIMARSGNGFHRVCALPACGWRYAVNQLHRSLSPPKYLHNLSAPGTVMRSSRSSVSPTLI